MVERRSLIAPKVAALLLVAGVALTGCGDVEGAVRSTGTSAASSTASSFTPSEPSVTAPDEASATPSPSASVVLEMSPDPASSGDALEVTVQNHSSEPWSWDCAVGRLYRWSGKEWQEWRELTDVSWYDETLNLSHGRMVLDCEPQRFLEPGATEVRHLDLAGMRRQIVEEVGGWNDQPERLTDGRYWLGFSEFGSSVPVEADAAGTFEIRG